MSPEHTKAFLLLWLASLVLFDVLAVWFGGRDASISAVIADSALRYPVIPLVFGLVVGHLFWRV